MSEFCEYRNGEGTACDCIALIGIGANLSAAGASPMTTCRQAVATLDSFPGMKLGGLSRWFHSAPIPRSAQPRYVNAVVSLRIVAELVLDPALLLANLMTVEAAHGRERSYANAPRTLDLDIIGIGQLVRLAPDPILPHPRAHLRAFVLAPLIDVAPTWLHPVFNQSAAQLLSRLDPQDVYPADLDDSSVERE